MRVSCVPDHASGRRLRGHQPLGKDVVGGGEALVLDVAPTSPRAEGTDHAAGEGAVLL